MQFKIIISIILVMSSLSGFKPKKEPSNQKWSILTGNLNSRWNVLNPANMLQEPAIQRIEPEGIPLLKVDPIRVQENISMGGNER